MSHPKPDLDVNALTDVLELAAATLDFIAMEMDEGLLAMPATADRTWRS